jgi:hypothetical protein
MPVSGQKCQASGLYRPDCFLAKEVVFNVGDEFTDCKCCGKTVRWRFVREVD